MGRFGSLWGDSSEVRLEVRIGGIRHFEIAREDVEDAGHVGGALDVGVAAEGVDAASGAADVAEQELQDGRGADGLGGGAVLGESHRVEDGGCLLHVAIFSNGSEEVGGFEELVLRDAGDTLDHLGGVARVVLLEELENRAGMLEGEVVQAAVWSS